MPRSIMLSSPMFKPLLYSAALIAASTLMACKAATGASAEIRDSVSVAAIENWPSLSMRLECLPEEGALVAAHRGVSRGEGLAENTIESLKALHKGGIRIAEIDVAQLGSGEHILFHDGVWEDKSTGQGPVASSQWRDVQKYLLNDTEGRVSNARPTLLEEALAYSKGRLYLEIDFKSSADYGEVIKMIRAADMTDDVVLIAYNERQASVMAKHAPDMFISVSVKQASDIRTLELLGVKPSKMMAWVGRSENRRLMKTLAAQNMTVLTYEAGNRRPYLEADVFVTDRALEKKVSDGAIGLSAAQARAYSNCIKS